LSKPKILIFDIETAPILAHVWGLWENNVGLNQVISDWHVLSWSAKWYQDEEGNVYGPHSRIMYSDQRKAKNVEDDSKLLKGIWSLLDEADVVITQNGRSFDQRKLQARFIISGMKPNSSYRHIDTKLIAQKHFAFPSHKLEYMADKLCTKYKKLKTKEFIGHDLWKACLKGDLRAWKEMEKYNKHDVLALEELYTKLRPWDTSVNFNVYNDEELLNSCACGTGYPPVRNGYAYTNLAKYQRYKCPKCGAETRGRQNLLSTAKRSSLRSGTNR
jgi:hypothetical protein